MTAGGGRPWRDRRGMATTELALVLPLLLLLSAGTIEAGLMLMVDASLELGMRRAIRFGMTNQGGGTREDNIRAMLTEVMKTWKGDGTIDLTFRAYSSLDNVGRPEPFTDVNGNGTCDAGEQSPAEKAWYQQIVDQTLDSSLMKRYASIDEQVGAILFLASDEASYITGVTLPVGGGDLG